MLLGAPRLSVPNHGIALPKTSGKFDLLEHSVSADMLSSTTVEKTIDERQDLMTITMLNTQISRIKPTPVETKEFEFEKKSPKIELLFH